MPNPLPRRAFLGGSAATLGFALAGAGSLDPFTSSAAAATRTSAGYGPLRPAGPLLSLPKGFSYKVIGESGRAGAGGFVHPGDPDAMGCFARPGGGSTLVSNHGLAGSDKHAVPHVEGLVHDVGGIGGTTTIVLDADNTVVEQYASVSGTWNNCAGGVTPWGTWLTCEETEARAGGTLTKDHGYVFEVDPTSQAANIGTAPLPLKFLGRYAHEAAAVDPATGTIYLTEDAGGPNGLYYRWTPPAGFTPGKGALHALAAGGAVDVGTLEAMRCVDEDGNHVPDLSIATEVNTSYAVHWVAVPDRDARTVSVRKQFTGDQVARSRKLEGQWWADGGAYFVASFARHSDGSTNEHDGQVWFYDPTRSRVRLKTLFGVNPAPATGDVNFDGPDNITVSPHGGLILAEDGEGRSHLAGVTEQGKAYPLALNLANDSEFCGPVFDAAGTARFANIQSPGTRWRSPDRGDGRRTRDEPPAPGRCLRRHHPTGPLLTRGAGRSSPRSALRVGPSRWRPCGGTGPAGRPLGVGTHRPVGSLPA